MLLMPGRGTNAAQLAPIAVAIIAGLAALAIYFARRPAKKLLDRVRKSIQVIQVVKVNHDTKIIRLSTGNKNTVLGLPVGKHVCLFAPNPQKCLQSGKWNGKDDPDKGEQEVKRSYTPTSSDTPGFVELLVKVYRPGEVTMPDGRSIIWADGGKMSLHLDSLKVGDWLDIDGPLGLVEYLGKGAFKLPGRTKETRHVGMLAGGTGITPMLQIVSAAMKEKGDSTKFSLIYANKTEDDMLCRDQLDELARQSGGRFQVHYTLDFPPEGWTQKTGFITADMIKECLPAPSSNPLMLMCGPPPMVEFACKKNLEALGYEKKSYVNM